MAARRFSWLPSISVFIGLALVGAVGARAYRHTASRDETAAWVSHTHTVLETLDGLLIALDDAVAARRGYALGGDVALIAPYQAAVQRVAQLRATLRHLTGDNPVQQARLDALEALLSTRMAQLDSNLRPGPQPGLGAEVTAEGNAQSNAVRKLVASLVDEERRLLAEREAAEGAESVAVRRTLLGGFSLSGAVLLVAFLWLRREMSHRARTEDTLASREQRTSLTLRSIADGVIATDADGRVVQMNPVAEQLTGWPLTDAAGKPFAEVFRTVHEKTRAPQPDPVAEVLSSGAARSLAHHTLLVSRDGTERPVADRAAPIVDADGHRQGVVLVFRDVSTTRASEARFRRLLEAAPDAILITDRTGHITMANEQVHRLFGHPPSELSGQRIEFLIPERLRDRHERHRAQYQAAPTVGHGRRADAVRPAQGRQRVPGGS